jgi:hypothetical protein
MQFQYNPHVYASALLSLAKNRHQQHRLAMMAIDPSSRLLLERIKRVTGHHYMNRRLNFSLVCCFLLAVIAGISFRFTSPNPVRVPLQPRANKLLINPGNESVQKTFVLTSFVLVKEKPKKTTKTKYTKEIKEEQINDESISDPMPVSNNVAESPDDGTEVSNAKATFTPESREYSIVTSPTPSAPATNGIYVYPYVPNSSYSFQITEDTSKPQSRAMTYDELEAETSLQKTLQALNQIDWKKIEAGLSKNGKKVDINRLKNEIARSLENVDWNQINQDIPSEISDADQKRILENLQMQSMHLQNNKYTNKVRVQTLRQIKDQQEHWNQNELRKETETLQKTEQQLRKRILRIIYI